MMPEYEKIRTFTYMEWTTIRNKKYELDQLSTLPSCEQQPQQWSRVVLEVEGDHYWIQVS